MQIGVASEAGSSAFPWRGLSLLAERSRAPRSDCEAPRARPRPRPLLRHPSRREGRGTSGCSRSPCVPFPSCSGRSTAVPPGCRRRRSSRSCWRSSGGRPPDQCTRERGPSLFGACPEHSGALVAILGCGAGRMATSQSGKNSPARSWAACLRIHVTDELGKESESESQKTLHPSARLFRSRPRSTRGAAGRGTRATHPVGAARAGRG